MMTFTPSLKDRLVGLLETSPKGRDYRQRLAEQLLAVYVSAKPPVL